MPTRNQLVQELGSSSRVSGDDNDLSQVLFGGASNETDVRAVGDTISIGSFTINPTFDIYNRNGNVALQRAQDTYNITPQNGANVYIGNSWTGSIQGPSNEVNIGKNGNIRFDQPSGDISISGGSGGGANITGNITLLPPAVGDGSVEGGNLGDPIVSRGNGVIKYEQNHGSVAIYNLSPSQTIGGGSTTLLSNWDDAYGDFGIWYGDTEVSFNSDINQFEYTGDDTSVFSINIEIRGEGVGAVDDDSIFLGMSFNGYLFPVSYLIPFDRFNFSAGNVYGSQMSRAIAMNSNITFSTFIVNNNLNDFLVTTGSSMAITKIR